jgi:hypothetical protein
MGFLGRKWQKENAKTKVKAINQSLREAFAVLEFDGVCAMLRETRVFVG